MLEVIAEVKIKLIEGEQHVRLKVEEIKNNNTYRWLV